MYVVLFVYSFLFWFEKAVTIDSKFIFLDISGVLSTTYQSIDIQLLSDLLGGLEGS